ncbi:MAG TPA: sigma-54 dependent transcriptional regulator [Cyclobacteriaceae bacterium]
MERQEGSLLIVDDDRDVLETARMFLKQQFEQVIIEPNPNAIPRHIEEFNPDVILLDMNFRKGMNDGEEGFYWLKQILDKDENAVVILITAYGEVDLAVKAIKMGAIDFVLKPWKNQKLLGTILSGLKLRKSKLEVGRLRTTQRKLEDNISRQFGNFIGESPVMQRVFELINKVADTDANVLILGENGTGKELVARALHNKSSRKNNGFISVDLGAVPENLFESELFGHTKGAFTDAKDNRVGSFELASGGTLFLDEIGNITPPLQAKLLAVIQNRKIKRVGSNKDINIDIRLICATNLPLYEKVRDGSFRQDLMYRINTVEIMLPALRERSEDIALLTRHFADLYCKKYMKPTMKVSKETISRLQNYNWPGNVRELQHAIERAVILAEGNSLQSSDLLLREPTLESKPFFKATTLEEMEKKFILQSLKDNQGNVTQTARTLGLTRTALYRRLNKYGL